jgi:hypothetical protein
LTSVAVTCVSYYLPPDRVLKAALAIGRSHGALKAVTLVRNNDRHPEAGTAGSEATIRQLPRNDTWLDVSAYIAGAGSDDTDLHIFFNDTLLAKHAHKTLSRHSARWADAMATLPWPVAAGIVVPTTSFIADDPLNPNRKHLGTFFIAMNRAGKAVFDRVAAQFLPPADRINTLITAIASGKLDGIEDAMRPIAKLTHTHLYAPPNPTSWPSAARLKPDDALLRAKAGSVLFEYLLSTEILRAGGMLYPLNVDWSLRLRQAALARLRR